MRGVARPTNRSARADGAQSGRRGGVGGHLVVVWGGVPVGNRSARGTVPGG